MVTVILTALLLGSLLYCFNLLGKHFAYWKKINIPCDRPNWFAGNLLGATLWKPFPQIWQEYYEKYKNTGPFAGFYWFTKPGVFVLTPSLTKQILIKDFCKFTDRGMYCNEKDDPLTGSIFNLEGDKWRNLRNKLSPIFTSAKMKIMFPLILKECEELVKVLHQKIAEHPVVEMRDMISRFTTDVIGSCALGIEINSMHKPSTKFRHMCRRALVEQRWGMSLRFNYPHLARRLGVKQTVAGVEEYFMDLIRKTVECREESKIRRDDFMDILIDLKNNNVMDVETEEELTKLTFGQVAAQVFLFLLAGFESTSTSVAFALYELAQNQEIQDRARHEVQWAMQKHHNNFSYECMQDLIYLNQIMQGITIELCVFLLKIIFTKFYYFYRNSTPL